MLDDNTLGKRDNRGNWAPNERVSYGPFFTWPIRPVVLLKWFFGYPGYLFPWNVLYAVGAVLIWLYLTPSLETMATFAPGWIAFILVRNLILAIAVYSAWHLWLYTWRRQGKAFKYNPQWPKTDSSAFLFRSQNADNVFWTLASGVPIWTAYEVLLLWAYANGIAPMIDIQESPILFVAIFFVVPFIHEVGFYFAHRLLHWAPLYRLAHHLHHRNINPGPWSGLSMHPVEHAIYFASILLFFIVPGHPIHMINLASRLGVAPAQGHTGFDRVAVGDEGSIHLPYYAHYLHHKYFEVNYSDGMVPLDRIFGSFHDGSPEAHAAMIARRRKGGVGQFGSPTPAATETSSDSA